MGQRGVFRCDCCGFESELNLSQPARGMLCKLEEFFCSKKKKIAKVYLPLFEEDKCENLACYECSWENGHISENSEEIDSKTWYDSHPECRMENLRKLERISDGNNVIYECPCHACKGTMRVIPGSIMCWD